MIKTDNDYLVEYVREKWPVIEESLDFRLYKLKHRMIDSVINAANSLSKAMWSIEMQKCIKQMAALRESMTPEEWEAYLEAVDAEDDEEDPAEDEQEETNSEDEEGCGRCFGASFGDCDTCPKDNKEE